MSRVSILVAMAAILVSPNAFAQARNGLAEDALPIATAKIPLEAAVVTALQQVQGRATKAEYEKQEDGKWAYEVEVTAGAKVFEVTVDPEKGTVIKSVEEKHGEDGEKGGKSD